MSEITVTIADMSGGLRTDADPSRLAPQMTPECHDVVFDGRTVAVRPGRVPHGALPAGAGGVRALCEYHHTAMGSETPTRFVAIGDDGRVYASTAPGQSFEDAPLVIGGDTPLTVSGPARLAQFNASIYLCEPGQHVRKFFGVDTSRWAPAYFGAGVFGDAGPGGLALDAAGNVYVCDPSQHRIVKFNSAGVLQGWYGYDGATAGYHTTGTPQASAADGGFYTPRALAVGASFLIVADTENNRIQKIALANGAMTWKAQTYGAPAIALSAPRAVTLAPDGTIYVGLNSTIVKYTADGAYLAQTAVTCAYKTGTYTLHALASDGTGIFALLSIRYSAGPGAGSRVAYPVQQYAGGSTPFAVVTYWLAGGSDGLTVHAENVYVVCGRCIEIYSTTGAMQTSVLREDYSAHLAINGDGVWFLTHPMNGTVETSTVVPGNETDYLEIADVVAPTQAPVVERTAGTLAAGIYDVCYTYVTRATSGSSAYDESRPSPVTSVSVHDAGSGLKISVMADAAAGLDPADTIRLYVRGHTFPSFGLVSSLPPPVPGSIGTVLVTELAEEITALNPYVSRPPKGCTLLLEWQGRMVYGKDDVLYISQWDNPDYIAPLDLVDDPSQYGLWARIGTDGGVITGLGKIGSYLAVFKRRGVWLVSGEPGTATFAVQQISESNGCLAHDTIQQVGGNLLVWLDRDRVWGFNGQAFLDLGQVILPTLESYREAEQQQAFAVYDPQKRWYLLTLPRAAAAGEPDAETLVLYHRENGGFGWTRWTAQPGRCAIYAHHSAVPGVYAGDGGSPLLYRLNAGACDATPTSSRELIRWAWYSKVFQEPSSSVYKAVSRCRARLRTADPDEHADVTVTIRNDGGQAACSTTRRLTASVRPQAVQWHPPLLSDLTGYQVGVSGASTTALELLDLTVQVAQKGWVR